MRPGGACRAPAATGSRGAPAQPARREDLGHAGDVLGRAAVRGARQREVAIVEPEALEHPGVDGRERLKRLGRRAQEGLLAVLAVLQAPDEAVLALQAPAALDDDPAGGQAMTVSAPGQTPKTASTVSPM